VSKGAGDVERRFGLCKKNSHATEDILAAKAKKSQIGFVVIPLSRLTAAYLGHELELGTRADEAGVDEARTVHKLFRVFPPQSIEEEAHAQVAAQSAGGVAEAGGKLFHDGISQPNWTLGAIELELSLQKHIKTYGAGIFGTCGYISSYLRPVRDCRLPPRPIHLSSLLLSSLTLPLLVPAPCPFHSRKTTIST
jgi:hypothetical protein